ncbi:MAG: hypothetical protein CMC55_09310 [Flavobacteriaceae bacterium]|nr:hypothetical protein [Flavobacteriaceae bacterium]
MPTNISVSNINLTTADISWNSMDNHIGTELEYGLFGFQLSSGAVINTSNQFITLTDLIPNTRYSV